MCFSWFTMKVDLVVGSKIALKNSDPNCEISLKFIWPIWSRLNVLEVHCFLSFSPSNPFRDDWIGFDGNSKDRPSSTEFNHYHSTIDVFVYPATTRLFANLTGLLSDSESSDTLDGTAMSSTPKEWKRFLSMKRSEEPWKIVQFGAFSALEISCKFGGIQPHRKWGENCGSMWEPWVFLEFPQWSSMVAV